MLRELNYMYEDFQEHNLALQKKKKGSHYNYIKLIYINNTVVFNKLPKTYIHNNN